MPGAPTRLLAIDQGTTSTRAILFDEALSVLAADQREFPQIFPRSGWVEHDPEDLWTTTVAVAKNVLDKSGTRAADVAAIGITNQRETTVIWERATGKPIHNAIVWQDRRTAARCAALREAGRREGDRGADRAGARPVFLGDQDRVAPRQRARRPGTRRARRACLRHGRFVSALASDRGQGARDRRHQCVADARLRPQTRRLRARSPRPVRGTCRSHAGDPRLVRRSWPDRAGAFRRPDPDRGNCRGPACGDGRSGLLRAGHGEVDLRHRCLRPPQYRQGGGRLVEPAAHHGRLSARRSADLRARGRDLRRRCGGAVAPRRPRRHRPRTRDRSAGGGRRSRPVGLSRPRLRRPRRALLGCRGAGRPLRADAGDRSEGACPRRARSRSATRRAT